MEKAVGEWCSVWRMYQCRPNQEEGKRKREKGRVGEITPGGVRTICSFRTPVVIQESLEGVGKWAEALGASPKQKVSHAGQRHRQDESWNLEEEMKAIFNILPPASRHITLTRWNPHTIIPLGSFLILWLAKAGAFSILGELFLFRTSGLAAECTDRWPEEVGDRGGEERSGVGHCPVEAQRAHELHREQEEEDASQGANTLRTRIEKSLKSVQTIFWTHTVTFKALYSTVNHALEPSPGVLKIWDRDKLWLEDPMVLIVNRFHSSFFCLSLVPWQPGGWRQRVLVHCASAAALPPPRQRQRDWCNKSSTPGLP